MLWANNHTLTLLAKQTDTSKCQLSLRGYTWLFCLQFSQVRLCKNSRENCVRSGYLVDTSHSLVQCPAKEHENCDIVFNKRSFHLYIVYLKLIGRAEENFEIFMHVHLLIESLWISTTFWCIRSITYPKAEFNIKNRPTFIHVRTSILKKNTKQLDSFWSICIFKAKVCSFLVIMEDRIKLSNYKDVCACQEVISRD